MVQINTIIDLIKSNDNFGEIANSLCASTTDLKNILINAMTHTYTDHVPLEQLIDISCNLSDSSDSSNEEIEDSEDDIFNNIINQSKIKFSEEQISFMRSAVIDRKNIALLAPAGYGKSETLNTTIKLFKHCIKQESAEYFNQTMDINYGSELVDCPVVHLCASTGRAASLLNARTIHSLLGIGLANGSPLSWYNRISFSKNMKTTYYSLMAMQCLIIDEISMIGGKLLDKISEYFKLIKHCDEPFGGMQIIFVGDFAQMPPINDSFAFQSKEFNNANILICKLTKCFRQSDPVFQRILDGLRFGKITSEDMKLLQNCKSIDRNYSNGMQPTLLRSTNKEVDFINEREMENLCNSTKQITREYKIIPVASKTIAMQRCKTYMIPTSINLAIDAQVMVTFNISRTIVNGTIGKVKMMMPDHVIITLPSGVDVDIPYIGFKDPNVDDVYTAGDIFKYMPLRVAYAISIHKAQGATIPLLEIDCKNIFVAGQLYVGISRVKDLKGLIIKNLFKRAIICSPLVKQFYQIE